MTTRPGYIWSGTEWVSIGQEAVVAPVSYQASAPSTPSTGDIWIDSNDDVPGIDTSQFLRWRKTAVGGETSVSGTDDNGLTLQYTANYEQVYLNGVLLVRGQDYTATNGTSITGLTALAANDVVEVFGVVARVVGDTYTQAQADAKYSPVTTTGLVLLNTTTFSATSTVSLNNCFSSSYDNYRIVMTFSHTDANPFFYIRMRSGGTDNTSSTYDFTNARSYNGMATSQFGYGATTGNLYITGGANQRDLVTMDIANPFLAANTLIYGNAAVTESGTAAVSWIGTVIHRTASSFDGITLYFGAGTMTGTIKVYGYK